MTATHRDVTIRRPGTPSGIFLRATALNEPAGELSGEPDTSVFARAFVAAVRLRFRPDTPLSAISASVAAAARRHAALGMPVREGEMLIREALGEQVPTAGIPGEQTIAVHVLLFAALADELALTDDELDELIADAEQPVVP